MCLVLTFRKLMRLTRKLVENELKNYHTRSTVGDYSNPLRRVFTRLGVKYTDNAPQWLTTFIQRARARNNRTISAGAALTLLNTIK